VRPQPFDHLRARLLPDPGRDPLTTQIRAFWPSETAPIVTAFAVTEGTRTELLYRSLYPGQSRLHGRPVAVSRDHGLGTISTAGFHLWYLEPAGIYHWLPELTEKRGGNDGKEPESALPHTLALAPNYPNPFNPVTTIEFSLPAAGEATVTIYNVLGQEVERLVHSRLAAGSYTVTWDGAAYSSGVYFYRLETAELSISRKMLLVK